MASSRMKQGSDAKENKLLQIFKKSANTSCYAAELHKLKRTPIDKRYFKEWISQLMECVSFMSDTKVLFIKELIIDVPWQMGGKEEEELFSHFIMCLVTSHNYLSYDIINALFYKLRPNKKFFSDEELASEYPDVVIQSRKEGCLKICRLICKIAKAIPLVSEGLGIMTRKTRPFTENPPVCHVLFLYNLLHLSELIPSHRMTFLREIFLQMVNIDLYIDREQLEDGEDLFNMDCDIPASGALNTDTKTQAVKSLDAIMIIMFRYIHSIMHGELDIDKLFNVTKKYSVNSCIVGSVSYSNQLKSFSKGCGCRRENQDEAKCKAFYFEMRKIFIEIILPTYLSSHVQYLMFYMLANRPSLIYDFLDLLRINFESPNNSLELRRNALSYIGSLLTRSKFIPFKVMYSCLEIISKFCLSYINQEFNMDLDLDSVVHGPFYYAAQVLFYVFTFRYKEFTSDIDELNCARALQLDSIVNSKMNPLRHCLPAIAVNFAAVSCHFQLAYCYTVMARNESYSLAIRQANEDKYYPLTFLPFEPYLLPRSSTYVDGHYMEFSGLDEEIKMKQIATCSKRDRQDSYSFLSCSPDAVNTTY